MEETRHIATALVAYWKGNPSASDTLDGIAKWWLPGSPRAKIEAALRGLIERGVVEASTTPNGHMRYRWRATGSDG